MNRNRRFAAALATTALLAVPAVGLVSASSAGAATVPSHSTDASQSPYKAGFRAGYSDGFEDAKDDCARQQFARLTTHQQDAYERGYAAGYDRGYSKAYDRFCWDD